MPSLQARRLSICADLKEKPAKTKLPGERVTSVVLATVEVNKQRTHKAGSTTVERVADGLKLSPFCGNAFEPF